MTDVAIKRKSGSLQGYISSLQITEPLNEKDKVSNFYYALHTVLNNQIPRLPETIIWGLYYALEILKNSMISLKTTTLSSLYHSTEESTGTFIIFKLGSMQFTLIYMLIIIFVSLFQFGSLIFAIKSNRLSLLHSRLLNMTLILLPGYFMIFSGVLLGFFIITNTESQYYIDSDPTIVICVSIFTIIIFLHSTLFQQFTKFMLFLGDRVFSNWEYPFNHIDYLYDLISSVFLIVRVMNNKFANSVFFVIHIINGIYSMMRASMPINYTFPARYLYMMLPIQKIAFGMYGLINWWAETSLIVEFIYFLIIHLACALIAAILADRLFSGSRVSGVSASGAHFDPAKLGSRRSCLATIRLAMYYHMPVVKNTEYLSWLLQMRYSPSILCDIVRICIMHGIDMSKIKILRVHVDTMDVGAFRFLAFQVKEFYKYTNRISDREAEEIAARIRQESAIMEQSLQMFWTCVDYNKMSIGKLAEDLHAVTSFARKLTYEYPNTPAVVAAWEEYANEVAADQSLVQKPIQSMMTMLRHNDMIDSENAKPVDSIIKGRAPRPIEVYLRERRKWATRPTFIFMAFTAFLILVSLIYMIVDFNLRAVNLWTFFIETSTLMRIGESMSVGLLWAASQRTTLPSPEKIQTVLNLSIEEAGSFRALLPPSIDSATRAKLAKGMQFFPHAEVRRIGDKCKMVTLYTLLSFEVTKDGTIDELDCYASQCMHYSHECEISVSKKFLEIEPMETMTMYKVGFAGFAIIFSILFVIFLSVEIVKQNRTITALQNVYIRKPKCVKYIKDDESRHPVVSFLIRWVLLIAVYVLVFVVHFICYSKLDNNVTDMMHLINSLFNVSSAASYELSISMFLIDPNTPDTLLFGINNISCYANRILESIQIIRASQFAGIFTFVPETQRPLNEIFNDLNAFSQLLNQDGNTIESFNYLLSRYLYLNNIVELHNYVLSNITDIGAGVIQSNIRSFFLYEWVLIIALALVSMWIYAGFRSQSMWYRGANTLLRREIRKDPVCARFIQQILEGKEDCYIDELPFPAVLTRENGRIAYTNNDMTQFVPYTQQQLFEQNESDVFKKFVDGYESETGKKRFLVPDVYFREDGTKLSLIRDVTSVRIKSSKYQEILKRMSLPFETPLSTNLIYFFCDHFGATKKSISVSNHAEETLSKHPNVVRLTSSGTYFSGIILGKPDDTSEAISFMRELMEPLLPDVSGAITEGHGTIITLDEKGSFAQVIGEPIIRNHDIVISTREGVIFADYTILERAKVDISGIISISPLHL